MSTIYANLDYQRSKHQCFSVYIDLIIFLDKNCLKKYGSVLLPNKKKILLSRTYEILGRTYEILSRTYDILSRPYEILSRTYEILSRTYDILSRTYEITMSYVRDS